MDPLCSAMIYLNPLKPAEEGRFEIFNQVHYQLCYFGYLKREGKGGSRDECFTWLTSTTRIFETQAGELW